MSRTVTRKGTYTVAEAAARLGVSVYTVRKDIEQGAMPTVPFSGRVVRIPAAFVESLLSVTA